MKSKFITNKFLYRHAILEETNSRSPYILFNLFNAYFSSDSIRLFLFLLRTTEYYKNCKTGYLNSIIYIFIKYLKFRRGIKLGFTIPENVFDVGLQIPHYGTIIVNANAKVGRNCRIHACTNIGASGGRTGAPRIGNNVYIAPGVKIYGDITIASNTTFAANAAVGESILEEGYLVGGVPAKVIKPYNNCGILKLNK